MDLQTWSDMKRLTLTYKNGQGHEKMNMDMYFDTQ